MKTQKEKLDILKEIFIAHDEMLDFNVDREQATKQSIHKIMILFS